MIKIIKELKIEVSKPNIFQAVVAKQYDMNTRFIKATFVDGSDIICIPAAPTVKAIINAERPDGHSKGFDGVVNEDGTVTVPLHSWMLEMEGTVICDISIIDIAADDNKKLTTTAFTLLVEKASYGGGDITNDPQYDVIVTLLENCTQASIAAEEALNKSNEALTKSAEANAKYDACVEATENANAVREEIEAGGYIESLKEMNNGGKFSFWVGTQEQYDKIGPKTENCFYIITDDKTDFVVESSKDKGTSVYGSPFPTISWIYHKWSNGLVEMWGFVKDGLTLEGSITGDISLPVTTITNFYFPTMVNYGLYIDGQETTSVRMYTKARTESRVTAILENNGERIDNVTFSVYAVGLWK